MFFPSIFFERDRTRKWVEIFDNSKYLARPFDFDPPAKFQEFSRLHYVNLDFRRITITEIAYINLSMPGYLHCVNTDAATGCVILWLRLSKPPPTPFPRRSTRCTHTQAFAFTYTSILSRVIVYVRVVLSSSVVLIDGFISTVIWNPNTGECARFKRRHYRMMLKTWSGRARNAYLAPVSSCEISHFLDKKCYNVNVLIATS